MVLAPAALMLSKNRGAAVIVCCLTAASCTKSGSPSEPSSQRSVSGQTLSVVDNGMAPNVALQIGTRVRVTSDATGAFSAEMDEPGSYPVVMQTNAFVERKTSLNAPAEGLRLSLIPSGFDLRAFDEMARTQNSRLQRWTTQPRLVVLTTAMRFTSMGSTSFPATGEQLTEAEVDGIISDVTGALALLTNGTWTEFTSVHRESAADGAMVETLRTGMIVIGRYKGVQALANTIGWGRWAEQGDGSVYGGAVYLDRDFDTNDDRRRLLRTHEMGHALGYTHVTSRESIMNPSVGPEPTTFDRQAARIAYDRPPGNKSPDEDPSYSSGRGIFITTGGPVRWSPPIP